MTVRQLQAETNKPSSQFHDLRKDMPSGQQEIGSLRVEVLQCVGLPKLDALGETDAYCLAVCGSYAFRTDTIPENADPRWLSKMRRACIFPIFKGYARLYVGVFDADAETDRDDFAGRTVLDLSRLRPNSTYDILLPLRESAHVYTKRPRGAVRLRILLSWKSERAMILSYLPRLTPRETRTPNVTVACADKKAFQSIALTAHGTHMPGRFSLKLLRSIIREVGLTQINILRYLRLREIYNLRSWKTPLISSYVFFAWMHGVYWNTPRYLPGHVVTFVLLRLWQNYLLYAIDEPFSRGFLGPTFEELLGSLVLGRNMIAPLEFKPQLSSDLDLVSGNGLLDSEETGPVHEKAISVLREVPSKRRRGRQTFSGCDAANLMVERGLAKTRVQAASLCKAIMTERVFERADKHTEFEDNDTRYHFLSPASQMSTAKTHNPWGRTLRWAFGPLPTKQLLSERAEEMPFVPSAEYPRRSIEESLVPRSRGLSLTPTPDVVDDEELLGLQGPASDDDRSEDGSLLPGGSVGSELSDLPHVDPNARVEYLAKPPPQDIDIRTKADKPVSAVLRDLRDKVHKHLLHTFEEKAYELQPKQRTQQHPMPLSSRSPRKLKRSVSLEDPGNRPRPPQFDHHRRSSLRQVAGTLSELTKDLPAETRQRSWSSENLPWATSKHSQKEGSLLPIDEEPVHRRRPSWSSEDSYELKPRAKWAPNSSTRSNADVEYTKAGLDRLLKTGMNSTSNPWVSKMGVLLQPMIEMALAGLSLFRSLHNLFTWRDPVLSVWFSLAGMSLVLILHLFPWRLGAFVAGVALVGPQNWVLRKIRESKGIPEPPMDMLIHKPRREQPEVELSGPPFSFKSNSTNDSSSLFSHSNSKYRHVVVPHSQLMFSHRFYEWPPDPRYSRVLNHAREEEHKRSNASANFRTVSLLTGNAESHWAFQFMSLDQSDSSSDADGAQPVITFSLATGHYRAKTD